jgi:hypothetical protein
MPGWRDDYLEPSGFKQPWFSEPAPPPPSAERLRNLRWLQARSDAVRAGRRVATLGEIDAEVGRILRDARGDA